MACDYLAIRINKLTDLTNYNESYLFNFTIFISLKAKTLVGERRGSYPSVG